MLAALYANSHRDPKKSGRSYKPEEFMPGYKAKPQDWQDMLATVKLLNEQFGGTVVNKNG